MKLIETDKSMFKVILISTLVLFTSCSKSNFRIGSYSISTILFKPESEYIDRANLNDMNIISFKKNSYCKLPGFGFETTNCGWEILDSNKSIIKIYCDENSFEGEYKFNYKVGRNVDTLILENETFKLECLRL